MSNTVAKTGPTERGPAVAKPARSPAAPAGNTVTALARAAARAARTAAARAWLTALAVTRATVQQQPVSVRGEDSATS